MFDDVHYINHEAVDFYHTYKEDIALFAEMGMTSFNTTVSWARIYPHGIEGGVNREGVEFYRNVFQELRKYHIEPVITLYKYDEPVYFDQKYGGWTNRKMIDEFVAFATTCFNEYKGLVNKKIDFCVRFPYNVFRFVKSRQFICTFLSLSKTGTLDLPMCTLSV